jgi:hypothetical protein
MKKIVLLILATGTLSISSAVAQQNPGIWVIDLVKIKPGKEKEALYFYENNWLVFRKSAKEKGYIKSYQLLHSKKQDVQQFDLMLMTEFADSTSFKKMEENFRTVMEARTGGARFLNELRPKEFMEFVNSVEALSLDQVKKK